MSTSPGAPNKLTETAPKEIWLQVSDDTDHYDTEWEPSNEISWCAESVLDCEVKYIRADLAALPAERAQAAEPVSAIEQEEMDCRAQQAADVMPLIGGLLDAWDHCGLKSELADSSLAYYLSEIDAFMEGTHPAHATEKAAEPVEQRTTQMAQIGGTIFGKGIKFSTIIDRAYREFVHRETRPAPQTAASADEDAIIRCQHLAWCALNQGGSVCNCKLLPAAPPPASADKVTVDDAMVERAMEAYDNSGAKAFAIQKASEHRIRAALLAALGGQRDE